MMALFAMITLGFGELIGSTIIGRVIDKYGLKVGVVVCFGKLCVAMIFLFTYLIQFNYSVLTYIFPFFWGLQDSCINTILNCTNGFEFESKSLPFSVANFI